MDFIEKVKKANEAIDEIEISGNIEDSSIAILSIKGSLDTYNSQQFKSELKPIVESLKYEFFIFEVEELSYISSTGVGAVIDLYIALSKRNVSVALMKLPTKIKEVFELLGFLNQFHIISEPSELRLAQDTVFPVVVKCPSCESKLKLIKSGKFKCSSCKKVIRADEKGNVSLSQ